MDKETIPPFSESLSFVAIDTETTGLSPERDDIIEVAAVKYTNGILTDTYNSFVKPAKAIPHFIEYLTHITPKELDGAPHISIVLKELKAFIADNIIVGHNTRFDLDFINHKYALQGQLPLLNPWWDTSELSRIYLPFVSNHKLTTLCDYYNVDITQAHRAIHDAKATAEVLIRLCSDTALSYNVTVNARILALTRQAQLESHDSSLLELLVEHQRKYALLTTKAAPAVNKVHNIIEHKCLHPMDDTLADIFQPQGILERNFDHYEYRSGQYDMSEAVQSAFANNDYLVVEAGTGVGKSFAYLIPALQFSYKHKKKVIISTNTKNLQEQLFNKDLPKLKEILRIPFKAMLIKGRENYICERKWEEMMHEQMRGVSIYEAQALLHLIIWKMQTNTGDVSENTSFDRNRFSIGWRRLCSERYTCSNRKCIFYGKCYVMQLRQQTDEANLLIVNHSLLLSDFKSEHASLGEYEHLVVDEAHNIMQTAAKQLGIELSFADLINQLNQLSKLHKKKNIAFLEQVEKAIDKSIMSEQNKEHIRFVCKNIETIVESHRMEIQSLFVYVTTLCEGNDTYGKYRIKTTDQRPQLFDKLAVIVDFWKDLLKEIRALSNIFSGLNSKQIPSYDALTEKLGGIELRAVETESDLLNLYNPDLDEYAFWLESAQKNDKNNPSGTICYAPIEVDRHLKQIVYQNVPCAIFTSATMALRNSFKFYLRQSGLALLTDKPVVEKVVDSPFDYAGQSKLLITGFLPEPADRFFLPQALEVIDATLKYVQVGTLALFTSYKDLDAAFEKLNDHLYQQDRPLFAQGKTNSRSTLLEEFKKHHTSVLLGTNSFWEGIDVQGESLSLLILFKLPFQVPSEPIVEAYIDKLTKEEKDSFMHYILPNALLRLRQGFGRLIRSKSDRGVVIIIDPRVETKKYGHYFKEVLPAVSQTVSDPLHLQNILIDFYKKHHSQFRNDHPHS